VPRAPRRPGAAQLIDKDLQAGWVASRCQDCPGRYLSNDTIQLRYVHETSPGRIPTGWVTVGVGDARAVAAALSSTGTGHLYLMTTQPRASRYSIIATGVFTTWRRHFGNSTPRTVRVKGGTFKVHHGGSVHVIKRELNFRTGLETSLSARLTLLPRSSGNSRRRGPAGFQRGLAARTWSRSRACRRCL
jgi:hypothetical protein